MDGNVGWTSVLGAALFASGVFPSGVFTPDVGGLAAQEPPPLALASPTAGVELDELAVLDFRGRPAAPEALARVTPRPGGGWAVSGGTLGGPVHLFDSDGDWSANVGGSGQGPGEFAMPPFGAAIGDELWLLDPRNARLTRVADDGEIVAERRVAGRVMAITAGASAIPAAAAPPSAAPASGRRALASGNFQGPDGESGTLMWIGATPDADVVGGEIRQVENPREQFELAVDVGDEVWAFSVMGGVVTIYSPDLEVVDRATMPLEEMGEVPPAGPLDISTVRPPPQVAGVMRGAVGVSAGDGPGGRDGGIWVVAIVASSRWTPGVTPADGIDAIYDTRFLRIDPATRTVTHDGRTDAVCQPVGEGVVSCADELGEAMRLYRLRAN